MFCKKCGNYLEDDELFCPNCGTAVAEPQAPRAAVNAQPSPAGIYFTKVWDCIRKFFSGKIFDGLREEMVSTTHEWIVFIAGFVILFAVALPVFLKLIVGSYAARAVNYGTFFGVGFFLALVFVALVWAFMILHVKAIMKNKVSVVSLLNVIGYSLIPCICALLLGMLFALIWGPLGFMLLSVANLMMLLLLYSAIKEYGTKEAREYFVFVAFVCAITAILLIFTVIISAAAAASSIFYYMF